MPSETSPPSPVYVTVSALDAGHLTLPERLFVTDADPDKRSTVPSLSFLIQHTSADGAKPTNLAFDLGVKRDISGYTPAQQAHIAQRQPVITHPDCADSIRHGANQNSAILLDPEKDIDFVILSHVHWDHVGTPGDFPNSTFLVGSGTLDLLAHGAGPLYPSALFNHDELPMTRTVEFPPVPTVDYTVNTDIPKHTPTPKNSETKLPAEAKNWIWKPLGGFPFTLDLFGDESIYVIDSPGHLYGHVNLLVRISEQRYVYLGGDCCHDPRIFQGEKGIAMYEDGRGGMRSVHVDTHVATQTLERIRQFVENRTVDGNVEIEVIMAHDGVWREQNRHRFWPNHL